MSNPKRTLAEKITIMQAADAGAKIAVNTPLKIIPKLA